MIRSEPAASTAAATVYMVEDDPFVRGHMELLFDSLHLPCRGFETAMEFLALYRERGGALRGCLLLDHEMPEMTGMELFEVLTQEGCALPVVMVTGTATVSLALKASRTGIFDFIEKPVDIDRLVDTVHRAFAENDHRIEAFKRRADFHERLASLTPKEREVMELMVTGIPTKVLAYRLNISDRTAEKHRQKVMHKLRARNLLDIIYIAQEVGLVQDLGTLRLDGVRPQSAG